MCRPIYVLVLISGSYVRSRKLLKVFVDKIYKVPRIKLCRCLIPNHAHRTYRKLGHNLHALGPKRTDAHLIGGLVSPFAGLNLMSQGKAASVYQLTKSLNKIQIIKHNS
jgi:hypothetical protein